MKRGEGMDFTRCKPEDAGILPEYIDGLVAKLESRNVDMHSLLIAKGTQLIFEKYYKCFDAHSLQRLFSITKSFTAVGVGLLVDDGLIRLDEKNIRYFPEKAPKKVHPWIEEMTVRDCLMMRTCYEKTVYDKFNLNSDWVASFFNSKPTHKPGMIFHYDTGAAHTLCALVEKLSGRKLMDFIRSRLPELGISENAYILEGPLGVSQGGTGLMATVYDMLRFGRFIMDRGRTDGRQLMDEKYIDMLVSNLTPTLPTASHLFESYGYGCQFWRFKHGACCYGMGGQMIFMDEEHDLLIVTTADTQGYGSALQAIHDAVNEELIEKTYPASALKNECKIVKPAGEVRYRNVEDGGISELALSWNDEAGNIEYKLNGRSCRIEFGFNEEKYGQFPVYDMFCSARAEWLSEEMLYIYVSLLDTSMASVRFTVCMSGENAVMYMRKTEETMFSEYTGHCTCERID